MPHWGYKDRALIFYQVSPRQTLRRIAVTGGPFEDIADWRWDREHEASTDPSSERIVYSILEQGRLRETRVRRLDDSHETTLAMALFEPQFSREAVDLPASRVTRRWRSATSVVSAGPSRRRTNVGLTSIGWSADGARIFYLQRTDRPDGRTSVDWRRWKHAPHARHLRTSSPLRDVHRCVAARRDRFRPIPRGTARALDGPAALSCENDRSHSPSGSNASVLTAQLALTSGTRLGVYEISAPIGEGGPPPLGSGAESALIVR